jgi:hypothetical protein
VTSTIDSAGTLVDRSIRVRMTSDQPHIGGHTREALPASLSAGAKRHHRDRVCRSRHGPRRAGLAIADRGHHSVPAPRPNRPARTRSRTSTRSRPRSRLLRRHRHHRERPVPDGQDAAVLGDSATRCSTSSARTAPMRTRSRGSRPAGRAWCTTTRRTRTRRSCSTSTTPP